MAKNLTPGQVELLRTQVFDAEQPGPVLHDFGVLLDHIPADGLPSAGKYALLPLASIPVVDALLARPLRLRLERPQLRSHPPLELLYFLARATGLIRLGGEKKSPRLFIDARTRAAWDALNPCERYFALLGVLIQFDPGEFLGARRGFRNPVLELAVFLQGREQLDRMLGLAREYLPASRSVVVGDLFGLIRLTYPPVAEHWAPTAAAPTEFGVAFGAVLRDNTAELLGARFDDEDDEDDGPPGFATLHRVVGAYFPAYQNGLAVATEVGPEGVYVYKVGLGRTWRRLALRHDHTLHHLLRLVLRAFDFDYDHLYEFRYRDSTGRPRTADSPEADGEVPADTVELREAVFTPGAVMDLTYDFGDNWKFKVTLEAVEGYGPSPKKLPAVLAKHGEAPEQYPNYDE